MMAQHARLTLYLVLALTGCGSGATEPANVTPRIGLYDYSLHVPFVQAAQNEVRYAGTLRITYATPDSIAASVDVPAGYYPAFGKDMGGLRPAIKFGFWNVDAYYFWVEGVSGGPTVAHRILARSQRVECKAILLLIGSGLTPTPVPASCTLSYRGP